MAAAQSFRGCPFPGFSNEAAVEEFTKLSLKPADTVMVSIPKAGTTWVNKILYLLLRTDTEGVLPEFDGPDIGANGQIYPDWLPVGSEKQPVGPGGMMGNWSFDDLKTQHEPRLFSTHVPAGLLPEDLKQCGRCVYVLRNPKDCLNSLHYFRGEAKDGWLGNEHGPGSFERYITGVNAYGSFFDHVSGMEDYIHEFLGDRALVLYYEQLKGDITGQVGRIADFLGVEMTRAKLEAVLHEVDINTMKAKKDSISSVLIRKGVCKDWENAQIPAEKWLEFDAIFEETIGSRPIAQPFRSAMTPSSESPQTE